MRCEKLQAWAVLKCAIPVGCNNLHPPVLNNDSLQKVDFSEPNPT